MKILKVKSRTYKNKDYYKYRLNIPERIINEAEISEKDELEIKTKKGKIEIIKI
jgi:hypothetical protein